MDKIWISVKDKLPYDVIEDYECEDVLILFNIKCDRCGSMMEKEKKIAIGYMIGYPKEWNLTEMFDLDCYPANYQDLIEITHWMPLPELPKD